MQNKVTLVILSKNVSKLKTRESMLSAPHDDDNDHDHELMIMKMTIVLLIPVVISVEINWSLSSLSILLKTEKKMFQEN